MEGTSYWIARKASRMVMRRIAEMRERDKKGLLNRKVIRYDALLHASHNGFSHYKRDVSYARDLVRNIFQLQEK